jgi:RecB family endonuclease NucS
VYDEMLFIVDADKATPVDRVDLSDLELRERAHLQEWILANPAVLGPGVEIVTSEYDRWQTAEGDPVLDRLDILGIDPDGRIVVAELKRGMAPHTVHMQAINYAAMVSRLTPDDVAELYSAARVHVQWGCV